MDTQARDDATLFLRRLAGDSVLTFQTLPERVQSAGLIKVLHGNFECHEEGLQALNTAGAGIFVMVNEGDGKGRKEPNVHRVRAVFVDLDGAPLEPVQAALLPPHIVVQTSVGKYHAYWLVSDVAIDQFKTLQQQLARMFGGDRAVCDLPRVMRLPGFLHQKGSPFLTQLMSCRDAPPYALSALVETLGLRLDTRVAPAARSTPASVDSTEQVEEGSRNTFLFTHARGFHAKGIALAEGLKRIQKLNLSRCDPPLPGDEVEHVVGQAYSYANDGFIRIPHRVIDSPRWAELLPQTQAIILAAVRRFNGHNNGDIALPFSEFKNRPGFSKNSFYKHRAAAEKSGFLRVTRAPSYRRRGEVKDATRYAIEHII